MFPTDDHPDSRISEDSLAALWDAMNQFARGDWVEVDLDVKRLCPDENDIWTIRSHMKQPQLRLFGWFVLPKCFVAVHPVVRDDLEIGDGPKWDAAIAKAFDVRAILMGDTSLLFFSWDSREYVQNPK